jgi:flagellar biosynthesis/type III secretory pathway protein FliH
MSGKPDAMKNPLTEEDMVSMKQTREIQVAFHKGLNMGFDNGEKKGFEKGRAIGYSLGQGKGTKCFTLPEEEVISQPDFSHSKG